MMPDTPSATRPEATDATATVANPLRRRHTPRTKKNANFVAPQQERRMRLPSGGGEGDATAMGRWCACEVVSLPRYCLMRAWRRKPFEPFKKCLNFFWCLRLLLEKKWKMEPWIPTAWHISTLDYIPLLRSSKHLASSRPLQSTPHRALHGPNHEKGYSQCPRHL